MTESADDEFARVATLARDRIAAIRQGTAKITDVRPRTEDYDAIFLGGARDLAREAYAPFWETPPPLTAKVDETTIEAHAVFAAAFANPTEFPSGYLKVAQFIRPDTIWVMWRFLAPGASLGTRYDGLVWREGDRFAWFPKPWKVLT